MFNKVITIGLGIVVILFAIQLLEYTTISSLDNFYNGLGLAKQLLILSYRTIGHMPTVILLILFAIVGILNQFEWFSEGIRKFRDKDKKK
jgi:hypothetical protein